MPYLSWPQQQKRSFSEELPRPDEEEILERVIEIVKVFPKVNPEKVTPTSHFMRDLGLDSLDAVELVIAFEEEFACDFSDEISNEILSIPQAVKYLNENPDIK